MVKLVKTALTIAAVIVNSTYVASAGPSKAVNLPSIDMAHKFSINESHYSLVSGTNPPESCSGFFLVKIPTLQDGLFEISECLTELKRSRISREKAINTIEYVFKNTLVNHVDFNKSRNMLNLIVSDICELNFYGEKIFKDDVLNVVRFVQESNLWDEESSNVIENLKTLTEIDLYSMECLNAFEMLGN